MRHSPLPSWLLEPAGRRFNALGCHVAGTCRGRRPPYAVGDDVLHDRMMIDRKVFVARAEVEDATAPAHKATATAEHLPATEGADKHQLVGLRDIEVFAVHLLPRDHERLRHARRNGMAGVDRPDDLAIVGLAPAQGAARAHQADKWLGEVPRMQEKKALSREHPPLHLV